MHAFRLDHVLLVASGGALGSVARYLLATCLLSAVGPAFPFGTLAVNVLGSGLLAGVIHAVVITGAISPEARLFVATGVLGGFMTYSTFSFETFEYLERGAWALVAANVAATLALCQAACLVGWALVGWLVRA